MKKLFKYILITVGVLAGFFIVVLAAAAVFISVKYPPAKLKVIAVEEASKALHRKVSIGAMDFSLFHGFSITDLSISNRTGWVSSPFLAAQEISISYHLWPLLTGHIALGEIKLVNPQVLVEKRAGGQFNFTDMMSNPQVSKTPVKSSSGIPTESGSSSASGAAAGALALSIDSISLQDGKVAYIDESTKPLQRYGLNDLNFKVSHISLTGGKTIFTLDTPFSYNQTPYRFTAAGSYCYDLAGQSLSALDVKGDVNGLGFQLSGKADHLADNFTPDMDGLASLNMLQLSGLVPKALSSMPDGLSMTGTAQVSFHLDGSLKGGLKMKGTADASDLAIQYKDLFVKQPQAPCKLDFTSVMGQNSYDLPSFHAVFQDWALDGSFHYLNNNSYSCALHSSSLPLKGLSSIVPKWKEATFSGTASLNVALSQKLNKPLSLNMNGQASLKDIGVALPQDPNLFQDLNGTIVMKGATIKMIDATFKTCEGRGAASFGLNLDVNPMVHSYALALQNVSGQEAVDAGIDVAVTVDPQSVRDKISGTLNLTYSGSGRGTTADEIEATETGSGKYSLIQPTIKGLSFITTINKFFKDKGDSISMDSIAGTLGLKNKVFSYTANSTGKVGKISVVGGVQIVDEVYDPNMTVKCDVRKEFLDSDAIKSQIPSQFQHMWDPAAVADSHGYVPIDFRFTGSVKKTPGFDCLDLSRMLKNLENNLLKGGANNLLQNAGNALKKLF